MINKSELMRELQKNPDRYWKVRLFEEKGFVRKQCKNCGKFFWTMVESQKTCNDSSCKPYDFIGKPLTKKKLTYIETWEVIRKFFEKNDHTTLKTFPVVCRWFPLYFTVAGIVDFYRLNDGELSFEFPANPSLVNQVCLRFNDIPNVGITGKHYSCFSMINQQSLYDGKNGYWKDKCIDLDFELLTKTFGIDKKEINFIEDAWVGPSAFGSSLEFHVAGLELGNAVFTEFIGTPDNYKEMKEKVIDMGAGLNRLAWFTQGTPTSYDVVFEDVMKKLLKESAVDYDKKFFERYSVYAGSLDIDEVSDMKLARIWVANQLKTTPEEIENKVAAIEALYAIADHTQNLMFALADGGIPSNTGGGHNLRVVLRRAQSFLEKYNWNFKLFDVIQWHEEFLRKMFPNIQDKMKEIEKIISIEESRYKDSKERTRRIIETFKKENRTLSQEDLIKYYDSEGIPPEEFVEAGLDIEIPARFYSQVTARHVQGKETEEKMQFDVKKIDTTELLYYKDAYLFNFKAKVLKVFPDNWIALDKTAFYPLGGGQTFDIGTIDGIKVLNVMKIHDVVLHKLEKPIAEGKVVEGKVDKERRLKIMKHHTATHIMLAASRKVLGSHVWQSGSEKTEEKARVDIAHYESLTDKEMEEIENEANRIVERNLPVEIDWMPRLKAEQKYGFVIYQGGVVPQKELRIVSIGNIDHEADGGTQVKSTKEVGFIKLERAKRIADGVVRLEYTAGDVAENYLKEREGMLKEAAQKLGVKENEVPAAMKKLFEEWKRKRKQK
jgi:alanyl-tRNA synthetase